MSMSPVSIPIPSATGVAVANDTLKFLAMAAGSAVFNQYVLNRDQNPRDVAFAVAGMAVGFGIFHYILKPNVGFVVQAPMAVSKAVAKEAEAASRYRAKQRR